MSLTLFDSRKASYYKTSLAKLLPFYYKASLLKCQRFVKAEDTDWVNVTSLQDILRPRGVAILCDMLGLMPVGFFMYLSKDDFLPGWVVVVFLLL